MRTPLSVLGDGLVSPFGLDSVGHVMAMRDMVPAPPRSAFVDEDDEPIRLHHCDWLSLDSELSERLVTLGMHAAKDAFGQCGERMASMTLSRLAVVRPAARPWLSDAELSGVERSLGRQLSARRVVHEVGAAGVFKALGGMMDSLPDDGTSFGIVIAVDSFVHAREAERVLDRPSPAWYPPGPVPSEGAAAIVVSSRGFSRQVGRSPLFTIDACDTAMGRANDDNDEIEDGSALHRVLRAVAPPVVSYASGQDTKGPLRGQAFHRAIAKMRETFYGSRFDCLEDRVGDLGAAAGLAALVYGAAALRWKAAPAALEPFVAWAMSNDGLRGAARARVTR